MKWSTAKLQVEYLLNICCIYVLHYIVNAMLFYILYRIPVMFSTSSKLTVLEELIGSHMKHLI